MRDCSSFVRGKRSHRYSLRPSYKMFGLRTPAFLDRPHRGGLGRNPHHSCKARRFVCNTCIRYNPQRGSCSLRLVCKRKSFPEFRVLCTLLRTVQPVHHMLDRYTRNVRLRLCSHCRTCRLWVRYLQGCTGSGQPLEGNSTNPTDLCPHPSPSFFSLRLPLFKNIQHHSASQYGTERREFQQTLAHSLCKVLWNALVTHKQSPVSKPAPRWFLPRFLGDLEDEETL